MIKQFFKTFLLAELVKGMTVTGRHLFSRKITLRPFKPKCWLRGGAAGCYGAAISRYWQPIAARRFSSSRAAACC